MRLSPSTILGIAAVAGVMFLIGFVVASQQADAEEVTVFKSPTCGCCKAWVAHLEQNGFKVRTRDVDDVTPYKIRNGVTSELAACHTAVVGDYVVEGHVPAADIKRLLRERPAVKGLAVPGMPVGSPGMEGAHREPYQVLTFDDRGGTAVYAQY